MNNKEINPTQLFLVIVLLIVGGVAVTAGFFSWYYDESKGSWETRTFCEERTVWIPKEEVK